MDLKAPPPLTEADLASMTEEQHEEKMSALYQYVAGTSRETEPDVRHACMMLEQWGINLLNHALDTGLDKLRSKKILPKRVFTSLYTYGHRCAGEEENSSELAQHHQSHIGAYLTSRVVPALDAKHGDGLLEEFRKRWDDHKIYAEWMRKMYLYLDRPDTFSGAESRETTTSVALRLFKQQVFDTKKGDIVTTIQDFVNKDRDGEAVDRSLLKSAVELFLVMGVASTKTNFKNKADVEREAKSKSTGTNETYVHDFEDPFIRNSAAVYHSKSQDWMTTDTVPEFLTRVEMMLRREEERVDAYLNPATWPKLQTELVRVTLQNRATAVLEASTGLTNMLETDKSEDVGRFYRLFSLWEGGRTQMSTTIREFVRAQGEAIIDKRRTRLRAGESSKLAGDDPEFVMELIGLQSKYRSLVADQCGNDVAFRKDLQSALNVTVNTNPGGERDPHPTGELVAVFLDAAMRGKRGGTKVTEEEISGIVADVHELFLLLNDKDLFQDSHRTLLSKRLLAESSVSNAMELEFIAKLKESQGPTYTAKFEGMLTDLTSPDAATKAFRSAVAGKAWDFDVRTLCHGHWPPAYATGKVTLPRALKDAVAEFSEYYREKQSSRKLDFALADGTMTVRGHFRGKGKAEWVDLRCSTLQGLLLLLFNSAGEWTAKDLSAAAGLELQDTAKLLHPLIFSGACRVLVDKTLADDHKAGKKIAKKVEGHHRLLFNGKFTSKRRAVGVPSVQLKKTFNKGALDLGRQHVLDAAIVRVMKARKAMRLNALVVEVETQVKRLFSADPRVTKKRIEHLIDQDYLERDESDRSKLTYVA